MNILKYIFTLKIDVFYIPDPCPLKAKYEDLKKRKDMTREEIQEQNRGLVTRNNEEFLEKIGRKQKKKETGRNESKELI